MINRIVNDDDDIIPDCQIVLDLRMICEQLEILVTQELDLNRLLCWISIEGVRPDAAAQDKRAIIDLLDRLITATCTCLLFFHWRLCVWIDGDSSGGSISSNDDGWRGCN